MKHRSINKVRISKRNKIKRQRRSNLNTHVNRVAEAFAWNSSIKGTYIKDIHGELK